MITVENQNDKLFSLSPIIRYKRLTKNWNKEWSWCLVSSNEYLIQK